MPLSNSNFPFPGVQNKQERHRVFENMQGFYNNKTVLDYYKPVDSTKKTITYIWFNNQFIDPYKMYGLYKCLVINTKSDYDSLSNVATVKNLTSKPLELLELDFTNLFKNTLAINLGSYNGNALNVIKPRATMQVFIITREIKHD